MSSTHIRLEEKVPCALPENSMRRVVRPIRFSDIPTAAAVAHAVYGYDPSEYERYFEWKWLHNPERSLAVVCEIEGQIVGCASLITCAMQVNGKNMRCALGADLMVLEEFRRQGIFRGMFSYLYDETSEDLTFVYGSGQRPTIQGMRKYHGWEPVGEIMTYKKYLSKGKIICYPYTLSWKSLARYVSLLKDLMVESVQALKFRPPNDQSTTDADGVLHISEFTVAEFGRQFDGLWSKASEVIDIGVVRSSRYLSWRYSNPIVRYRCLRADNNGTLAGYCIFRYSTFMGLKVAEVADTLATHKSIEVALLQRVSDIARDEGAHILFTWSTKTEDALLRQGFVKSHTFKTLYIHNHLADPTDAINDITKWYFRQGDLDSI